MRKVVVLRAGAVAAALHAAVEGGAQHAAPVDTFALNVLRNLVHTVQFESAFGTGNVGHIGRGPIETVNALMRIKAALVAAHHTALPAPVVVGRVRRVLEPLKVVRDAGLPVERGPAVEACDFRGTAVGTTVQLETAAAASCLRGAGVVKRQDRVVDTWQPNKWTRTSAGDSLGRLLLRMS